MNPAPSNSTYRFFPAAFRARWVPALAGLGTLLVVLTAGEWMVRHDADRVVDQQRADLRAYGSALEARFTRELSSVLYLTSGLTSYLAVRHGNLDPDELADILASLYSQARHVRNFGVAVGTTLTYVHPVQGNERAIGLNYPDVPEQWPGVKAIIDSGQPSLEGPLQLVQGGNGLIYRVPIQIDGQYWGLLSTVVDADAFLDAAFADHASPEFVFALQGKSIDGQDGPLIRGDGALFTQPGVEILDIDVPGGVWKLATGINKERTDSALVQRTRMLVWLLALTAGWYAFQMLRQRARLARLALYDTLTGLPNRRLMEDRIQQALLERERDPAAGCAVLVVDLDGFKKINDKFGHKAGDRVLQSVATGMSKVLRSVDSVARWGGDEFVVLLCEMPVEQLPAMVERIREAVEKPTIFDSHTLGVGASIGVALASTGEETVGELVRTADVAMYENKRGRQGPTTATTWMGRAIPDAGEPR